MPVRGRFQNSAAAEPRKPEPYISPSGKCVFCGKKLDQIFFDRGYHNACAPGWRTGSQPS
jgi:hypothetical protein